MIILWFNQETDCYRMGTESEFHHELREFSSQNLAVKYKMQGAQWNVLKKIEEKLNKSHAPAEA